VGRGGPCSLLAIAVATIVCGQEQQQDDNARLEWLADQVKDSLRTGSMAASRQFADELSLGVQRREKALEFKKLESLIPGGAASEPIRVWPLAMAAKAAFNASHYETAEKYAKELLLFAEESADHRDENYGVAVFYGNMVMGQVSLARDQNVKEAKAFLIASGKTPGSPTLNSFGPNMSLARDLLAVGEREVVLQFFQQCRGFWKMPMGKLDDWTKTVESCCRMPHFAANLSY
jgi:hypothetical protein